MLATDPDSMSLFRRPTDDSSSEDTSSEDEETYPSAEPRDANTQSLEETVISHEGAFLEATTSPGQPELAKSSHTDEHRDMMLAAVLEELSKYKAAELINNSRVSAELNDEVDTRYTAQSPEIQQFARTLFNQSGEVLAVNGLVSRESLSRSSAITRQQYLSGLQRLSYRNALTGIGHGQAKMLDQSGFSTAATALIPIPSAQTLIRNASRHVEVNLLPPYDLGSPSLPQPRSHYAAIFEEKGVLGRGGFGTVYHTYNILDGREYAVKKIPLSAKCSDRYRQGGHRQITSILREVHALSRLDHCNVVRYHATWIEEPVLPTPNVPQWADTTHVLPFRKVMLIEDQPAVSLASQGRVNTLSPDDHSSRLDGDKHDEDEDFFERDSKEQADELWSESASLHPSRTGLHRRSSKNADLSISGSSASQHSVSHGTRIHDPTVCVLHVQMSIYPMTLVEYLSPKESVSTSQPRHCFHLVPAIKILLSILHGLQYIHMRGFVHRDIKPSNIFLSTLDSASPSTFSEGYIDAGSCTACARPRPRFINPRIGDFGLVADLASTSPDDSSSSSSSSSNNNSNHNHVGTELYRPPTPQLSRPAIDEKQDIFATGIILLELLLPFSTRMERTHVLQRCQTGAVPPDLTAKLTRDGMSAIMIERIQGMIAGMIEPDQAQRWGCAMVKDVAEEVLAGF